MSAAEGVPLTRELLEALVEAAGMQSDMALPNVNLANVWYAVKQKCTAALASDAGTPEGEPHALDCAISEVGARHGCTCGVEPLDESGAAAPEERDGELSRLLWRFCEQAQPLGRPDLIEIALDAIHAHVEKVTREARAEGERAATGEVVATGTVTGRSWEGGPVPRFATVSLTVGDASRLPLGATVSLVLRREKEGA